MRGQRDLRTSGLWTPALESILELFSDLHRAGITVITITHDHEVARHAARTVRITDGVLTEDAPTALDALVKSTGVLA